MKNNDNKLKILSVIVAIFMWTYVINSTNPTVNKVFRSIPVVIKNQENLEKSGYVIVGGDQSFTTTVKLKGSREKIIGLKAENIYASVDISDLREGIQSLAIKVDTPSGVSVENSDPNQINLNIQKQIIKKLPVNLTINDNIKDGRIVEVNDLKPKEITVKGPASLINKVDRCEVKVDDLNLLDGKVHNLNLQVVDRSGNPIGDVKKSDEDVNISFKVYETKKVKIKLNTFGVINNLYEEVSRTINPESIVIKAPESVLKDVNEILTKPVNVNGLRFTATGEVELDLPESVEIYNGENKVNYKIEMRKITIPKEDENDKQWWDIVPIRKSRLQILPSRRLS